MGIPTGRLPLDAASLNATLVTASLGRWHAEVVAETGSTNADLLTMATAGAAEGIVRVAEYQTGGRGRLDRAWSSPPGAGLTFSLLLRPAVPLIHWGWLPLLSGVALADTIVAQTGGLARLKWPNDLLMGSDQRKVAGILTQVSAGSAVSPDTAVAAGGDQASVVQPTAAVIGIGVNVTTSEAELPVPTATSLVLQGTIAPDRAAILVDFLARFDSLFDEWQAADGSARESGLADSYRQRCATLGSTVEVELPDGTLRGVATDVDDEGRLLVTESPRARPRAIAAGDITHVRPQSG